MASGSFGMANALGSIVAVFLDWVLVCQGMWSLH